MSEKYKLTIMKELTIEQKAKAYDEALEKAKQIILEYDYDEHDNVFMEIFPELRESEDERIWKALITFFQRFPYDSIEYAGTNAKDALAWLEKQGTSYTKRDIDDAYVEGMAFAKHELEKQGEQKVNYTTLAETGNGGINALVTGEVSNSCDYEEKPVGKVEPKFKVGDWITNGDYTWKIVEVKPLDYILQSQDGNIVDDTISHVDEQFHSFTIQDAKDGDVLYSIDSKQPFIYKERPQFSQAKGYCCINKFGEFAIWNTSKCVICTDKYIPATKEQRDLLFQKMKEAGYEWDVEKKELRKIEQEPALSEEDESWFKELELMALSFSNDVSYLKKFFDWLKSLKDRVQPKQEWSEEDEYLQAFITELLYGIEDTNDKEYEKKCRKAANWLKSLKDRITWKPSEEQIVVLELASKYERVFTPKQIDILIDLKEQLKKLIE